MDYLKRSWAVIDFDALEYNVGQIRAVLEPDCHLMAVVKADSYGHGDRNMAHHLQEMGVNFFGVSNLEEALSLRTQGITGQILIFGMTPVENIRLLQEHDLIQTVHSMQYARRLHAAACAQQTGVRIHIKIDTGMSRVGLACKPDCMQTACAEVAAICAMERFRPEGIYSHFAVADEASPQSREFTRMQFSRFMQLLEALRAQGISFALRHCCNSAGALYYPEMHLDMVRVGIALYGLRPGDCNSAVELRPVMSLYSVVSRVKEIAQGDTVSYGRTFTAPRAMQVATVSIGYADGYTRVLSNKARMLLRGQYAPVIGTVCMDQLMLDITGIPGVQEGDRVTIVGKDGDHTLGFDEMAALSGTVHYEKVCIVGRRVPRVYIQNGRTVATANYMLGDKFE
jgi:alanine racemase